jgi:hypothetical protein
LVRLVTDFVDVLLTSDRKADTPAVLEFGSLRQSEMPGIDMNDLRRHCDAHRARPPRAPGMQSRRYNGFWWHF